MPLTDFLFLAIAGLPLIALAILAALPGSGAAFAARILPGAFGETLALLTLVGVGTSALGLGSAWLVTHFDFPGRRMLAWALVLPLAVPTYVSAYAWVELLEFTGPVQSALRAMTGAVSARDYWFPPVRSIWGAAFVMTLVLYPYVYLSCRAFFAMRAGSVEIAARTLGAGPLRSFLTIIWPLSRPALVVGLTLALLEVLNDLGAVSYFGVNTLSAQIYVTWINQANLGGAARLAVVLVGMVALVLWLEHRARARRAYLMPRDAANPPVSRQLRGWRAGAASALAAIPALFGFLLPAVWLAQAAIRNFAVNGLDRGLVAAVSSTVTLGLLAALTCLALGLVTSRIVRDPVRSHPMIRLAVMGYALPGTVLAVGLVAPFGFFDGWINTTFRSLGWSAPGLVLSGSIAALIYAYSVRFLMVAHGTIETGLIQRGDTILDAAKVLGAGPMWRLFRVDLPTLWPALATAMTLVFIECVKELPATLLLRPLGVETLATFTYARASAELFAAAALPALLIVLIACLPLLFLRGTFDRAT